MQYRYSERGNYEDLSSGRVLYAHAGVPNFPVRLLNEIFRRSLDYAGKGREVTVYDPCCGGGYLLTVLGFCNQDRIVHLAGSDIDGEMVALARRNTALLTRAGLEGRIRELEDLWNRYRKPSHAGALESAGRLLKDLKRDLPSVLFAADCTRDLPDCPKADVILTDLPYGQLTSFQGEREDPVGRMAETLAAAAQEGTVLAICMDKGQRFSGRMWERMEKQNVGKRRFEIHRFKGERAC